MNQKFSFHETELNGVYLIKTFYATDERGGFIKDYSEDLFRTNGINHGLKEVFYTISKKGVIRANHFQLVKPQAKLVRCISGHIYDVVTDLRVDSPTYKKWIGFHLTGEMPRELLIPSGCGHGYLVLEDSIVSYKCDENFLPEGDSGIKWDDPDIAIDWPVDEVGGLSSIIISQKDKELMSFHQYDNTMKGILT